MYYFSHERDRQLSSHIQTCFVSLDSSLAPSGTSSATIQIETDHGSKSVLAEAEVIMSIPLPLAISPPGWFISETGKAPITYFGNNEGDLTKRWVS
ncbi:hypothetical protein LLG10_01035 [bacterium]|nr:hypothetical protein [bacterium]